jgi:RNA polymerase sigma-70 factor, ECF subfamily
VIESRLTLQAVTRAISKLPAELQVLIALVCIDGRSYQEAAEITATPIGTVMSRLARARRTLHELMDKGSDLPPKSATEASHARS